MNPPPESCMAGAVRLSVMSVYARRLAVGCCLVCALVGARAVAAEPANIPVGTGVIRLGVTSGCWKGLNRNDAAAAISSWARSVLSQRGRELKVETRLYDSFTELTRALEREEVDGLSVLTGELLSLDPGLRPDLVFLAEKHKSTTERYVVVVRQDSGIQGLGGMRGRRLVLQSTARAGVAHPWLELLLKRASMPGEATTFRQIEQSDKPGGAVLQVFFRKHDLAVVTSDAFAVTGELNPQLGKQLRVLAESPEVVPAVFFFRPTYKSQERFWLEEALLSLHEDTLGQQILTVFQSERIVCRPVACLDETRELLQEAGVGIKPLASQ